MFNLFLGFCVFLSIYLYDLTAGVIMAFMEFLVANGASYSSLTNHISAVEALLGLHDIHTHIFAKPKVKLFLRSLQINRSLAVSQTSIIDIQMIQDIVKICDSMYMGQFLKEFTFWLI